MEDNLEVLRRVMSDHKDHGIESLEIVASKIPAGYTIIGDYAIKTQKGDLYFDTGRMNFTEVALPGLNYVSSYTVIIRKTGESK